jgi:carbonic anhydrase
MNHRSLSPFKKAKYNRPKKNILVLSCIDLRLTDNLVAFLHKENLVNRYDHLAIAGASLCSKGKNGLADTEHKYTDDFAIHAESWKEMVLKHVEIAVSLHQIEDVYIVEHEDCGAYKSFLVDEGLTGKPGELDCHFHFAEHLAKEIESNEWSFMSTSFVAIPKDQEQEKNDELKMGSSFYKSKKLNVEIFMMDVKGDVFHYKKKRPKLN